MRDTFLQDLRDGAKAPCPCCGRWAQIYRRALHYSVGWQLIRLYRKGGAEVYVNAARLIVPGQQGVGDFSKAKYWKLIERKPLDSNDNKKSSGYWKLTELGSSFVRGLAVIQKTALVFDDTVLGFDGPPINIRDVLSNKFDYKDLMGS